MNPIQQRATSGQDVERNNYEKGCAFEQYIIDLFSKKRFHLWKWRKSQISSVSTLLSDHGNPDLEMIFKGARNYTFAIECKWRSHFNDGKIEWAKSEQIIRYKKFQAETGITVFVAIGVGGEPGKPEKLFVTPLDSISHNREVYESQLVSFKRKTTSRFFYDVIQGKLF